MEFYQFFVTVNQMDQQKQAVIEQHLKQAFYYLKIAFDESVQEYKRSRESEEKLGVMWTTFLKQLFDYVQTQEKEHQINLINFASMFRLKKWF